MQDEAGPLNEAELAAIERRVAHYRRVEAVILWSSTVVGAVVGALLLLAVLSEAGTGLDSAIGIVGLPVALGGGFRVGVWLGEPWRHKIWIERERIRARNGGSGGVP